MCVYTPTGVDGQSLDNWLAAVHMAQNSRSMYRAHPWLLRAHLGEKVRIILEALR